MNRFFLGVVSAFCLVSLSSCFEKTVYDYKAPDDEPGRRCVNGCLRMKVNCDNSCRNESTTSTVINKISGIITDKSDDVIDDLKVDSQKGRCFDDCRSTHNLCYTNCGGKVITRVVS